MNAPMSKTVLTDQAPRPVGPYSQAVVSEGTVYCSGQLGLDPKTNQIVPGTAADQARQSLHNLEAVLKAAGASMASVVRTTIYLVDLNDFRSVNEIYAEFFPAHPPARSTVGVASLPLGGKVEIDVIATLSEKQ
jgi:2-iminobutanoate/2-iminopropanoate deaminase